MISTECDIQVDLSNISNQSECLALAKKYCNVRFRCIPGDLNVDKFNPDEVVHLKGFALRLSPGYTPPKEVIDALSSFNTIVFDGDQLRSDSFTKTLVYAVVARSYTLGLPLPRLIAFRLQDPPCEDVDIIESFNKSAIDSLSVQAFINSWHDKVLTCSMTTITLPTTSQTPISHPLDSTTSSSSISSDSVPHGHGDSSNMTMKTGGETRVKFDIDSITDHSLSDCVVDVECSITYLSLPLPSTINLSVAQNIYSELGHLALANTRAKHVICIGGGSGCKEEYERSALFSWDILWRVWPMSRINANGDSIEHCHINASHDSAPSEGRRQPIEIIGQADIDTIST